MKEHMQSQHGAERDGSVYFPLQQEKKISQVSTETWAVLTNMTFLLPANFLMTKSPW